jgi:hypothetical protein
LRVILDYFVEDFMFEAGKESIQSFRIEHVLNVKEAFTKSF